MNVWYAKAAASCRRKGCKVWAKVIEVTHQVNQRTGELNRVHILRVKEVEA